MHAKLFCKTGQLSGASYTIKEEATIGKGPENTIQIDAAPVSAKHAKIAFDKKLNSYVIEDLGSRNGTRIDGARVREKEKLGHLHIITFAEKYDFIFQVISEEVPPGPPPAKAPAQPAVTLPKATEKTQPPPVQKLPASPGTILDDNVIAVPVLQTEKKQPPASDKTIVDDGMIAVPGISHQQQNFAQTPANVPSVEKNFMLEVDNPKGGKNTFALHKGENTIGRIAPAEIAIDDNSLSRNHAVITVSAGIVKIKDLGSKNYTFVNRRRITDETEILPGSEIMFGVVQATLKSKD